MVYFPRWTDRLRVAHPTVYTVDVDNSKALEVSGASNLPTSPVYPDLSLQFHDNIIATSSVKNSPANAIKISIAILNLERLGVAKSLRISWFTFLDGAID